MGEQALLPVPMPAGAGSDPLELYPWRPQRTGAAPGAAGEAREGCKTARGMAEGGALAQLEAEGAHSPTVSSRRILAQLRGTARGAQQCTRLCAIAGEAPGDALLLPHMGRRRSLTG